ncbi:MAG: carbohydrate-binding family 9-like protein, partial [Lentisphaeria bacterium]|nr:carbohydrate-binding family 9-like protein [Lentisphaeria bacterium]
MNKKRFAILALATLPLLAAEPLTYSCHRPAVAPVIDGKVTADPGWRGIPGVTGFCKLGSDYTMAKQSIAMVCWGDEALTIAMVCEEPDAAKLKPVIKDGGQTWTEDSVEIFIQPDPKSSPFQIGVTCGGAKGAGVGSPDIAKCQAAAFIDKNTYELELRIPYAALGTTKPADSATWRIAFCRNTWTTDSGGDKFTSWPPLQSRFLEPENF